MVGLVSEEDCLVTLEGGGRDVLSARLIEVRGSGDAHEERAMTLAHTLCNPNLRIIVRIEERAGAWATIYGSTITREIARVVPAARLTVEAGGMGLMIEHDIQAHYDAVFNLLKAMGMYPGSPKVPAKEIIEIEENARVFPRRSGFWKRWVDAGAWVKAGDRLAAVLDELGTEIEALVAPFHGIILYIRGFGLVNPLASRQNPRYGVNVGRYAKPS